MLRTSAGITVLVNDAGIAMSGDLTSADPDRLEHGSQTREAEMSLRRLLGDLPGR